jgi:hypothetical protein
MFKLILVLFSLALPGHPSEPTGQTMTYNEKSFASAEECTAFIESEDGKELLKGAAGMLLSRNRTFNAGCVDIEKFEAAKEAAKAKKDDGSI